MALITFTAGNQLPAADLNTNFALAAGYVLTRTSQLGTSSPADGIVRYISPEATLAVGATASDIFSRIYIPKTGIIKAAYGAMQVTGTLSSGEDSTVAIRLNDTTSTTVSSTVETSAAFNPFSNNSLNIAVAAGDFIDVVYTAPTWATNPTGVHITVSILIAN